MTVTTAMPASRRTARAARHADAPDTRGLFTRLELLEEGPGREQVRDQLARAWLPMANRLADKYRDRGEPREDLRQVAALGLVKAIDRYDRATGPFEAYAVPTIDGEIKRHFRDHGWDLHVPRRVQDARNKVRRALRELHNTGHPHPVLAQIADQARLSVELASAGLEAMDAYSALSLDKTFAPDQDDSYSLQSTLGRDESRYDLVVDRESVKDALQQLPEREKEILYLRFFKDMTQARIAERLGISQMHVSRIINKTCARVRTQVLADTGPQRKAA
ncbi:SigB/SigF/SigG family RNA polymerase sigma factor [Streptomyces sp. NPDC059070]|uniref:SigB/SigF/SigG family RNA polymerase sigma factor n=1 Tax=Streptomyces sp. NPDC059070 TaxID=3346713 RepID=UPI0036BB6D60